MKKIIKNSDKVMRLIILPLLSLINSVTFSQLHQQENIDYQNGINTNHDTIKNYKSLVDPRDGAVYRTVVIGKQIWMAENLNYFKENGSWCYDDLLTNCEIFGRLYDWKTAKEACPDEWRLPYKRDIKVLIDNLGLRYTLGGKLKAVDSNYWYGPNINANNKSGFSGLPGGYRNIDGFYEQMNYFGYWWMDGSKTPSYFFLSSFNASLVRVNTYRSSRGFSVRCIKNYPADKLMEKDTIANRQAEYVLNKFNIGFTFGINHIIPSIAYLQLFSDYFYILNEYMIATDSARVLNINQSNYPGFAIGIAGNLRLSDKFSIRFVPSLSLHGDMRFEYEIQNYFNGYSDSMKINKSLQLTLIELPIYLKYQFLKLSEKGFYMIAGPKFSYNATSDYRRQQYQKPYLNIIELNQTDFYLDLGLGTDFFRKWFKVGTEIKYSHGFNNLLTRKNNLYTKVIDKLYVRTISLSFTFE